MATRPENVELIGEAIAIRWSDGGESIISQADMRAACPCALCRGEQGLTGPVSPASPRATPPTACQMRSFELVGAYGLRPFWLDGHSSGIYPFSLLRSLGETHDFTTTA